MHSIQANILAQLQLRGSIPYKLTEVGKAINVNHPQQVKHHLTKLDEKGLIFIDSLNGVIKPAKKEENNVSCPIISIPIYGAANCGMPLMHAEDRIQGILKISKSLLSYIGGNLIALKAVGDSMNKAKIGNKKIPIEDGDYIIIDTNQKAPNDGDYILSVIDDGANIKKLKIDKQNEYILLQSESNKEYPSIIIHSHDNYHVGGKVTDIIKKPSE